MHNISLSFDNCQPIYMENMSDYCIFRTNNVSRSENLPYIAVSVPILSSPSYNREIGRTEVIWDNLNPKFVQKFVVNYFFEETRNLKFVFYDVDDANR